WRGRASPRARPRPAPARPPSPVRRPRCRSHAAHPLRHRVHAPTRAVARRAAERVRPPGAGGSLGLGDAEAEIGFGYVMNQMQLGVTGDPRSAELLAAVYASLR